MRWIAEVVSCLSISHNFCSDLTALIEKLSCPRSSFFQLSHLLWKTFVKPCHKLITENFTLQRVDILRRISNEYFNQHDFAYTFSHTVFANVISRTMFFRLGAKNAWQNLETFGSIASISSQDYKNPAYFELEVTFRVAFLWKYVANQTWCSACCN